MSANRNFSHNSNFFFQTNLFSEEETSYAVQECNLPGMSFSHIQLGRSAVLGNIEGDTVSYNDLIVSLIIDEKLTVWKEIINKMQKMRDPISSEGELIEKKGFLEIHDDNSNLVLKLEFYNMMLEVIDDLNYNTTSEDEVITCTVTIRYDYYTVT